MEFFHKYLQKLPKEDTSETTGLYKQPKNTTGDHLFFQLQDIPLSEENSVICLLQVVLIGNESRRRDIEWLIDNHKDFWIKYVEISADMSIEEKRVLISVAVYFWRLENDSEFSENIPVTNEFR
ncbi:MAG: hypothetical protein ACRC4W_00500 [Treponemataceae bacterium]